MNGISVTYVFHERIGNTSPVFVAFLRPVFFYCSNFHLADLISVNGEVIFLVL